MALSIVEMRNKLFTLDLCNPEHQKQYGDLLYSFILLNEGSDSKAYLDIVGKVTVGIGFNMDAVSAKAQWAQTFGNSVSFADVYTKKRSLVESETRKLFDLSISVRRQEIKRIYGSAWDQFKGNEKVGIEDAYFNAPVLVSGKTNFYRQMCCYVQTGDQNYLLKAIDEIKNNSNPTKHKGIQNRRDKQAEMLSSHLCV
jgi:GH24 family phage-related lysozyme (muramidase)